MEVMQKPANNKMNRSLKIKSTTNAATAIGSSQSVASPSTNTTTTGENPKSGMLIRKYSDKLNRNLIDKIEPLGFLKSPDVVSGSGGGNDSIVVIKNKLKSDQLQQQSSSASITKNEVEDDDEHDELLADLDDVVDSGLLEKELNQLDRLLKNKSQIKKTNNECNNNQTNNNNNSNNKLNQELLIQSTSSITKTAIVNQPNTTSKPSVVEIAAAATPHHHPIPPPISIFQSSSSSSQHQVDSTVDAETKPLVAAADSTFLSSDTTNKQEDLHHYHQNHDAAHLHAHRHRHTHRHHNHHHHYHIINNFDTSESTDDPTTPHHHQTQHPPLSPFAAKTVDNKKVLMIEEDDDDDSSTKPIIIETYNMIEPKQLWNQEPPPSPPPEQQQKQPAIKSEQSNLASVSQNFYSTPDLTNLLVSDRNGNGNGTMSSSSQATCSPLVNLNSSLNNLNDEKNVNRAAIKTIVDYETMSNASNYLTHVGGGNSISEEKVLLNNSKIISNLKTSLNMINNNNLNKKSSQKFKMLLEGDVQVCKLPYSRNVISKILNSKLLRRWKTHRINLTESDIYSTTKTDYMDSNIPYHTILEVSPISKWEPGQKFYLRIATFECHYLIQTNNVYVRDQWTHSIIWKKHKFKSEKVLRSAIRPEVLIREIKNMIEMSLTIPIDDSEIYQFPLELVSEILQKHHFPKQTHEEVIVCLSPLLEKNHPSPEICDFFSRHCRDSPRSHIVIEMFTPVVQRILKHNDDFGRYLRMRLFIQDYLMALMSQNTGLETVQSFVRSMHSTSSQCPFPRVLPNFVAVCLAAIHGCFEQRTNYKTQKITIVKLSEHEREEQIVCYTTMLLTMAKFEDWRVNVAQLLQSVPFPDQALVHDKFVKIFKKVVEKIAEDSRCEVHQTLLGIREGKEGWFEVFSPGGISCDDDGELFGQMLKTLMGCCCKKKRFLLGINKLLSHIIVLAVREVPSAIETLCAMLDLDGVDNKDNKLQIVSALHSTPLGTKMYAQVCEREKKLKELQQKGGPRKLTLPSRSTDADLAKLLLSGSFGNLECLSLAFTNVTSACAQYLIRLPSLRYLNLWSTKFGDEGLELISEHLTRLQVLNLCETPVTDKGLACLASMKQLRKLNLNSTNLSALTFEGLKESLPALQECDIRYTDAW